jgi:hypothetical protein
MACHFRFSGRRSRFQGHAGRAAVPDPGSRRQVPSLFDIILADAGVEVVLSGVQVHLLHALPSPIIEPGAAIGLHVHRRDRLGGILHEYRYAA